MDPLHKRIDLKRCKRGHQPVDTNGCPFPLLCRRLLTTESIETRKRDVCSQIAMFGLQPYARNKKFVANPTVKLS